jgi:hypothetical protein
MALHGRGAVAILGIDPDISGVLQRVRSFEANAIFLGGSISRSPDAFLPAALSVAPVLSDLLKISSHFEKAALIGSIAVIPS